MSAATMVPVMCRNNMSGPTVLASDPKSTHEVIFGGKGSPNGDDVQPIPDELLRTPQFAKAIAMGIIEVVAGEDNEAVQAALSVQRKAFWDRSASDAQLALDSIELAKDNDMISVLCIGPGTRPGATCPETLLVREKEIDARPPLCARHEGLAGQCIRRGNEPWQLELPG